MSIWKSGRRLFSTAAILMILTAALHTVGNMLASPDAAEGKVFAEMSGLHFTMGLGMSPSLQDVYWVLVLTMSVTFAALGAINVVIAGSPDTALVRRAAWMNAVWVAVFIVLCWIYRIPPPLISGVVIEAFVVGSLVTTR